VKNHFDEIRCKRKNLNLDTYEKAIDALIEEMGDVFVDIFLNLPSDNNIPIYKINQRIDEKLKIYESILNRVYNIHENDMIS
jgi:hypothetical protein